ncbi:MAG: glycosyltransferase [Micromonosporaceae bacterium]|nr:glycosyltransferase [Micromonosporaceae bacterium]
MIVGVCDFPSRYAFPPHGYGGIERWLWAVAVGALSVGAEVHLIGPAWRPDLPHGFRRMPIRLEDLRRASAEHRSLTRLDLDLLVVGHEYPSAPAWRRTWFDLGCDVATFQHDPNFRHAQDAFDGQRSRLYCYSPEMADRYTYCRPIHALSVQFGLGEERPLTAMRGRDLVWLGRIHADKAPHIAVMAAGLLGSRIQIIGPVHDDEYVRRHADLFTAPHVEMVGEVAGPAKLDLVRRGSALVYTCSRTYVEAGAATFGEALRCGTPVAALAWRGGTCADAALCGSSGAIARVDQELADQQAAVALANAIAATERLDPVEVQMIGQRRFDPVSHFQTLAKRP